MKKILPLLLILFSGVSIHAQTSVWKISSGDSILYLGGTVHTLRESDYPLPVEYGYAFEEAGTILFETDIGELSEPRTVEKLLREGMYSDGSSLKTILEPEIYSKLAAALDEYMIPIDSVKYFKPGMLASSLSALSYQEAESTREGVDLFYYTEAVERGKKIRFLESVDVQIDALVNMGKGNENEFILYTLRDMDDSAQRLSILIDEWRRGGSLTMEESLKELEDDFPATYEEMVAGRNRLWVKKIRKYLQSSSIEFILFGTLHLHGSDGILSRLRSEGYRVEQLILEETDEDF